MSKLIRWVTVFGCAFTVHFTANPQSFGINTFRAVADPTAILDVSCTTKDMLIPCLGKTQRNAVATHPTGLMVFQNGSNSLGFDFYNGISWLQCQFLHKPETNNGRYSLACSQFVVPPVKVVQEQLQMIDNKKTVTEILKCVEKLTKKQ